MNPWMKLGRILSPGVKMIASVSSVGTDGTSLVTLRSGAQLKVSGDTVAAGSKAFIQNGRIIGQAPDLPHYDITI